MINRLIDFSRLFIVNFKVIIIEKNIIGFCLFFINISEFIYAKKDLIGCKLNNQETGTD